MDRCSSDTRVRASVWHNPADALAVICECLAIADVIVGTVIGYGSVIAYFSLAQAGGPPAVPGPVIWRELVLVSVIAALIVRGPDQGRPALPADHAKFAFPLLRRSAACVAILAGVGVATGTLQDMSRLWLVLWGAGFLAWLTASRSILAACWRHLTRPGATREGIVVIGEEPAASRLIDRLNCGANVIKVMQYPRGDAASVANSLAGVLAMARNGSIGLVVLTGGATQPHEITCRIVQALKAGPVQVAICPEICGITPASPSLRMIADVPLMLLADRPLRPRDLLAKMALDRIGAAFLLLLASPMLLAVAMTVLLETPGPIIFRQARTGWGGRLFTVYKFRTMRHAGAESVATQTERSDPRCTPVGLFLRRTSLDELPQLWNVLRGDMSLVGPRPHADTLHARERGAYGFMADYAHRHRVKPGLTGLAQVHGLRGAADTPEKLRRRIELDLYYIEHWSIWLDFKILARTPLAVLSAENAF